MQLVQISNGSIDYSLFVGREQSFVQIMSIHVFSLSWKESLHLDLGLKKELPLNWKWRLVLDCPFFTCSLKCPSYPCPKHVSMSPCPVEGSISPLTKVEKSPEICKSTLGNCVLSNEFLWWSKLLPLNNNNFLSSVNPFLTNKMLAIWANLFNGHFMLWSL